MEQGLCQRCGQPHQGLRSDRKWCDACRAIKEQEKLQRYEEHHRGNCPDCGAPMGRRAKYCYPCSREHVGATLQGPNNGFWKGGVTKSRGYVHVRAVRSNVRGGTASGGGAYRPAHRVVWEGANRQPLPKGWVIHHLNGVLDDNNLENLVAMPRGQHQRMHNLRRWARRNNPDKEA